MDVEEAVQRLLCMLGSCLAGRVALSAPRVLGVLLSRLGADTQVRCRSAVSEQRTSRSV